MPGIEPGSSDPQSSPLPLRHRGGLEFNKTWQEARFQRSLPSLCFSGRSEKNKMAALVFDWLRHFRLLLWNRWTEFNETWQEARSHRRLPSLCFSGRSEKQNGRPVLLLADTFSTSPLNRCTEYNGTWQESRSQLTLPSLCFSNRSKKNKIVVLWNRWTEFNETWQEARSQRRPPSLCFSGRSTKQDVCPGLWLAETFSTSPPRPLNGIQRCWLVGCGLTSHSAIFQLYSDGTVVQVPIFDLLPGTQRHGQLGVFSVSSLPRHGHRDARRRLLPLCHQRAHTRWGYAGNRTRIVRSTVQPATSTPPRRAGIQQDLTGSKISTSSTKFVLFGPIGKTKWPPWSLIGWDIFDFSSETAERNSTKLDRKQDLNVVHQVCVFFGPIEKNKMSALASDWLRHFRLLLRDRWTEFNDVGWLVVV